MATYVFYTVQGATVMYFEVLASFLVCKSDLHILQKMYVDENVHGLCKNDPCMEMM